MTSIREFLADFVGTGTRGTGNAVFTVTAAFRDRNNELKYKRYAHCGSREARNLNLP